jgi:hypothetical protein
VLSVALRETGRIMLISPDGSWYPHPRIVTPSYQGTRLPTDGSSHSNTGPTLAPLRGNHPSTVEYSQQYTLDVEPGRQQRLPGEQAVSGSRPFAPHLPASIYSVAHPPTAFIPAGRTDMVSLRSPCSFTFPTDSDSAVSTNSPFTPDPEVELEVGMYLQEDETTVVEQSAALEAATAREDTEVLINPQLMETLVLQENGSIDPSRPTVFSDSSL